MLRIQCPKCSKTLAMPESMQGKAVKCPHCSAIFGQSAPAPVATKPLPVPPPLPPAPLVAHPVVSAAAPAVALPVARPVPPPVSPPAARPQVPDAALPYEFRDDPMDDAEPPQPAPLAQPRQS